MKKIKKILCTGIISLSIFGPVWAQSQIYIEDFEDSTVGYNSSITEASNGLDDYFIRTDGSNISASFTNLQGTSFFAAQDIDGLDVDSEQTITFDDIDITDFVNLELRVYIAEDDADDGLQDWDTSDYLHIDYDIDNSGVFSEAIWVESSGGTNTYPSIDTNFDNSGDGSEITDSFTQFISSIYGSGTTIDVRITFTLNSGDEDIAIDNVELWGTAVGDSATQLAITDINEGQPIYEDVPFNLTVQAQDGTGNPGTTDIDLNFTLSLNSGSGALGGTTTGVILSDDSQTIIQGVTYDIAESDLTIEVTDDGGLLTSGISDPFNVNQLFLVLNEILADPGSDSSGDANNDGTRSSDDDEFLEFVNSSSNNLDISNWTISDESSVRHTFSSDPATILSPNQAVVVFGGGSPTGPFGGSLIQTTSSLSLGNTGETITVMDDSGNILIEQTYSGASNQSETRSPDISGNFTDHTSADSDDNSVFSPGTRIDGSPFQTQQTLSVNLDGGEGWRMISSPTSGNTYHDLLQNLWTQGTTGADYTGGEPNVMRFDGSNFSTVPDIGTNLMASGEGFIVYIYSDDDYDQTTIDSGFPKTLTLSGVPRTGYVEAPLNSGDETWSLVGNPYKESVDWDSITKSNLYGTVYVYDQTYGTIDGGGDDIPENGSVGGGYRTWNGETGSLSGGVIAPFQGFWVQSSGSDPLLIFEEDDQTSAGTFYTKENEEVISIRLKSEIGNMYNETFLSFTEFGEVGVDIFDALKLSPLDHRNYVSLSTLVNEVQMDINNLPVDFYEPIEIPLHVNTYEAVDTGWVLMDGEVTLSWPELSNIPAEWEINLTDKDLNRTINLQHVEEYRFEVASSQGKFKAYNPLSQSKHFPVTKEKAVVDARFTITINPKVPDGLINRDVPTDFTLAQNYPNPFNPTTNIKFEIAETSNVTLSIYNVMGQRISTLVNESKSPGSYEITWNAGEMASGIYYYRLEAGGMIFNRPMLLIK